MRWPGTTRRFVVLTLCSIGFGALAQEQDFFAGSVRVSFTDAQANRGKAVYDDSCANCHGANLDDGQFGPPLRGPAFKMHWSTQSASALFTYIATKMPPSSPGGLTDRSYSDVEAYILRGNGVAAGNTELAPARTQSDITVRTINQDATYQTVMAAREKLLAGLTPVTEEMLRASGRSRLAGVAAHLSKSRIQSSEAN